MVQQGAPAGPVQRQDNWKQNILKTLKMKVKLHVNMVESLYPYILFWNKQP